MSRKALKLYRPIFEIKFRTIEPNFLKIHFPHLQKLYHNYLNLDGENTKP